MLGTCVPHHHLRVLEARVPFYVCGAPALGSCIVGETRTNIPCILGSISSFPGDLPKLLHQDRAELTQDADCPVRKKNSVELQLCTWE